MTEESIPADDREDALEPRDLIRRSHLIVRTGNMMLGAGTSSLRVKEAMQDVAASLGVERLQAQITFTSIVVSVYRRGIFRTQAGEITTPGVNADKIRALQHTARHLPPDAAPDDIDRRLDEIARRRPLYPQWLTTVVVGLACVSVGFLNNGGWQELIAVLAGAMAAYRVHQRLTAWQLNLLGSVVISTAVASVIYLVVAWLTHGGELHGPRLAAGFVAAAIFLVPGFPLFTGSLDLARLDLQAGLGRVAYAALVMLSIGIGSWAVASASGITPAAVPELTGPTGLIWTLRVLASFLAVFGWATMFNAPWRECVASGLVAVPGSVVRLVMIDAGIAQHIATFTGALIIGVLCHVIARWFDLTRLIMLVPTLLVMIPGGPALRSLLYFNSGDLMSALANGIIVVLQIIAMVCGLVVSMMMHDPGWAFSRPDPPTLAGVRRRLVRAVRWRRRGE